VIKLKDKDTGKPIGEISEAQLQFLMDQLVEEGAEDVDYYLNRTTLEMLVDRGMDDQLTALLTDALGDRDELEFEWSRG
jgi:processive 1,2-diacylglycerol beta-glucosyltransferase